jgi:hypothetical protein
VSHGGGGNYFQFSTGSLLDDLSVEERQEIVLLLFIAHTDPATNPDDNLNWLHNIADEVLDYRSPFGKMEYIRSLDGNSEHAEEKSVFRLFVFVREMCEYGSTICFDN